MFRTQTNAFDDLVVRATDENLTSENWESIMTVCDKVGEAPTGPKDAVAALIKRLGHRNANVQLYTLEVANALSQNCGVPLHRELASRSFTEALLRLAGDRSTHQSVKAKILERMMDWAEMFSSNPELGIMEQAYMRLKTQNPHLQAPSQPPKTLITDSDRRREEDELQMALALSIKEKDRPQQAQQRQNSTQASSSSQPAQQSTQPVPSGTTAATVSRVRALYDFTPSESGELQFQKGDIIAVLESVFKDWWKGSLRGQTGIFPLNYVEKLQDPTHEELEREAYMEGEVFAEIKNVEKLLALLSTSAESGRGDVRDNEEITTLYHSTLAIRPKLIELIGKYSQKKDDFTQLNEKFIKARRDYETLLEASMSHPAHTQPAYPQRPYSAYAGTPQPGAYASSGGGQYPQQPQQYYSQAPPQDGSNNYPPTNGPQPFYFVPPGQGTPGPNSNQTAGKPVTASSDDLYAAHQQQQRPQSIAYDPRVAGPHHALQHPSQHPGQHPQQHVPSAPQELATGSFDSPVDGRGGYPPPGHGQAQQGAAGPSAPQASGAPYDPYAQGGATSVAAARPTSPYATQHNANANPNAPPPASHAMYTLPSQSAGRLASGSGGAPPPQPQEPYGNANAGGAGAAYPTAPGNVPPPVSTASPVHVQHVQHVQQGGGGGGYPPQGQQGGYQAYQAYGGGGRTRELEGAAQGA